MVVKKVSGFRSQVSGKTSANETTSLSLRPDTWLFQVFDLALQARVAADDRPQIGDVDDPGGGVGGKKVSVSTHRTFPLIADSRAGPTAIPGHGPARPRAADSPIDSATSKP